MQRLQLEDHGELGRPLYLVFNDVTGDFRRQSERKTHMLLNGRERGSIRGRLIHRAETGKEKGRWSDGMRSADPAAAEAGHDDRAGDRQPKQLPIQFHNNSMGWSNYGRNT